MWKHHMPSLPSTSRFTFVIFIENRQKFISFFWVICRLTLIPISFCLWSRLFFCFSYMAGKSLAVCFHLLCKAWLLATLIWTLRYSFLCWKELFSNCQNLIPTQKKIFLDDYSFSLFWKFFPLIHSRSQVCYFDSQTSKFTHSAIWTSYSTWFLKYFPQFPSVPL